MKRMFLSAIAALVFALGGVVGAEAQSFPHRPIKIIVPFPAGGPTDVVARLITQPMSTSLGRNVIIENQSGAGGRIGSKIVARATPDGYTLLLGSTNTNAVTQALYTNLDYDPVKDFAPVAALSADTTALVIVPSLPAKTLKEFIQYAKDNPGKLTTGATLAIAPHIQLELFRVRAGIDTVYIPYKGAALVVTDLLGGQIQAGISGKSVLLPHILEGRVRALAVVSEARWPELPDIPTMGESGFPGFPQDLWTGLLAPAGTPGAVIEKLNAAVNEGLKSAQVRSGIAKLGLEPKILTPSEFAALLADDAQKWEAVVKESGVRLE
jgi:tripartite-type tricarboxylate transporter receptor subunit TctC